MYGYCKDCAEWFDKCTCETFPGKLISIVPNRPKPLDKINPSHYSLNHKGIECSQAIEAALTKEQFIGFLRGNMIKYNWRLMYKDTPKENAEKAKWYNDKLIEVLNVTKA